MTEDQIPKFLRRIANEKEKEPSKFVKLIHTYESRFNDFPPTEPGGFTEDEWCEILEECIQVGKTVDELLGVEEGDDWYD